MPVRHNQKSLKVQTLCETQENRKTQKPPQSIEAALPIFNFEFTDRLLSLFIRVSIIRCFISTVCLVRAVSLIAAVVLLCLLCLLLNRIACRVLCCLVLVD